MANWRRGFFRVWILLSVIWIAFIGILLSSSVMNPYVPLLVFTYDDKDNIERLYTGSPRYDEVTLSFVNGNYEMVTFASVAPNVTFYSPNIVIILVGGKKYKMTFTNQSQTDRPALISSLTDYIVSQQPERSPEDIRLELERVVPDVIVSKYRTPEMEKETTAYAVALRETGITEQRLNTLGLMAALALIPPLVVLILGAGLGWALTGFRRERMPGT
jgi:hypothetical protein